MSTNALFVVAFVVCKFLVDPHYAFLAVQICALVLLELGLQCMHMHPLYLQKEDEVSCKLAMSQEKI